MQNTGNVWILTYILFSRVIAKNMEDSINERFKYFTEKIVPQFTGDNMDHTLIFVPNYLEYVKVRNWFKASDRDFCEISEYRYILLLVRFPNSLSIGS